VILRLFQPGAPTTNLFLRRLFDCCSLLSNSTSLLPQRGVTSS